MIKSTHLDFGYNIHDYVLFKLRILLYFRYLSGSEMKIIDRQDVMNVFPMLKGKYGRTLAEYIIRLCSINKINHIYNHSSAYTGSEFAGRLLNDLNINYLIGNPGRLAFLPEGAFITISNHPYGGLDGIILVDLLARIRPDYKLMVNSMLSMVKTMNENFISVKPTSNKKNGIIGKNIRAIRETLMHIQDGHPVGFFPSGAVSDFSLKDLYVRDRKWQQNILNLINTVKVPILPIRFFDANSSFFYFLGLINWKVRSFRMPSELFNKKGKQTRIGVGNVISVQEQEHFPDLGALGDFLRKAVYEMPVPKSFVPRSFFNPDEKHSEIIPA